MEHKTENKTENMLTPKISAEIEKNTIIKIIIMNMLNKKSKKPFSLIYKYDLKTIKKRATIVTDATIALISP